ncbi:Vps54-domain-containing protein [Tuber magnatum]|uniref:Vps54-domain-containing protein n=1 Tax=Tuber magnatum TaxID=42249 RepID=A0A317SF34_9PEZI|nr:Vps54-domain-containing protein [Tuber magnatum]
MSSPTPSRRQSGDSSVLLSPILSPTASQTDLTAAYPPRASRPPKERRGSTASSIISLNSSLGTVVDWRASKDYGGGAGGGGSASSTSISSLLETPQSRASAASRPKPGEIPPVTLTSIPKIKPSEFAPYLSISGEYEKYRRAKDMGLEEHIRLANVNQPKRQFASPSPSVADPAVAGGENGLLQNAGGGGDTSSANSSPRRRRARKGSLAATPLSTVPIIYFDENFQLENPRTFDVVSERSDVIRPVPANSAEGSVLSSGVSVHPLNSQRRALATNAILQEKLSWYMDTVEVHLISSISTASSSFFAALGDLRELHSEATASVQKIQGLRKELVRLDEEQAVKGLEIVRLRRRRDNVARLEGAVKQTERVLQTFQSAERALVDNEVDAALVGVAETDRLICGRDQEGLLDLRPVRALEAVSADLVHLRWRIGKAFEARFVEGLLTDLRKHVERVPPAETLRRFAQSFQREQYQRFVSAKQQDNLQPPPPRSSSLPPEYTQLSDSLRSQLMRHLNGLQRAKHVNEAVQAYRDAVIKEAKSLIRRNMPSGDDNESVMSGMTNSRSGGIRTSSQDKSLLLARSLRSLGPADSEDLLVRIYTGVSELVRRLGTQQKMLLDVTMRMGETGVGGMLSPRLEQNGFHGATNGEQNPNGGPEPISMDISDLISSAVEIAQSQIVKIVNVRSEQVTTYGTDWFLRYFALNRLFTQECEAVSVRVGSGLQNAVSAQIREFLNLWQRERIRMLAECLEKDKWAPREFEDERQKGINRIMEAATHDPEDWVRAGRIWELRDEEDNTAPTPTPTSATAVGGSDTAGDTAAVVNGNGTEANGVKAPVQGKPHAVVDNQKFILPESGIMVLKELEGYLKLLIVIPGMATDIANNLLSFLKVFPPPFPPFEIRKSKNTNEPKKLHNSRTYQLILGAGATKTAGLRSITTKHLAMASQGLSIITSLLPYLRETVRRRTPQSPTLQDFDKVKRTYQQYQSEIHTKLISIMSERVKVHVLNLKAQDWDATRIGEGAGAKYYMETLCKETTVLHKVLSKHLPKETLVGIMTPVFEDYRARLEDGFRDVVVRSEGAKERMTQDAQMFIDRLSKLDGYSNSGDAILQIARAKVVVGRGSTPAISTSSNNSGGS